MAVRQCGSIWPRPGPTAGFAGGRQPDTDHDLSDHRAAACFLRSPSNPTQSGAQHWEAKNESRCSGSGTADTKALPPPSGRSGLVASEFRNIKSLSVPYVIRDFPVCGRRKKEEEIKPSQQLGSRMCLKDASRGYAISMLHRHRLHDSQFARRHGRWCICWLRFFTCHNGWHRMFIIYSKFIQFDRRIDRELARERSRGLPLSHNRPID